mgnify:CR=1 FL=1
MCATLSHPLRIVVQLAGTDCNSGYTGLGTFKSDCTQIALTPRQPIPALSESKTHDVIPISPCFFLKLINNCVGGRKSYTVIYLHIVLLPKTLSLPTVRVEASRSCQHSVSSRCTHTAAAPQSLINKTRSTISPVEVKSWVHQQTAV